MLTCDEYGTPVSLDEAFDAIATRRGRYRLIAGATDTYPWAREGGAGDVAIRTALDAPQVTSIIFEDRDPLGPLGVKGIGEPAMVPTIPAITNAICDAVGVRITSLRATPEKVLAAIREKERRETAALAAE